MNKHRFTSIVLVLGGIAMLITVIAGAVLLYKENMFLIHLGLYDFRDDWVVWGFLILALTCAILCFPAAYEIGRMKDDEEDKEEA